MTLGRRPFCAIVNDTEVIVDNVTESNVERPTYKVTPFRHGHHVFELCLTHTHTHIYIYTGCPRRNLPDFGRVFLMLNYTDITQNT